MIFSSDSFIFLFLPIWLAVFFLFSAVARQYINWLIFAASLIFYSFWDVNFLPVIVISIVVNYGFVLWLKNSQNTKLAAILGVLFNLAFLGWYKYWCFFGSIIGVSTCDPLQSSDHLPLAISFFTFQQIAYLVDIHRHKEAGTGVPKMADYAAFISFFPHLIAGPITRSNELLKPIEDRAYALTAKTLELGLFVFFIGFAKKVFLADPLSMIANPIFTAAEAGTLDSLSALLGVTAFTLQIYFDFSGYSEMAVGLGLMIGIQLPWNFLAPYGSASVVDFWRRWHITLSTLLRDYLYISLGGNRVGEFRKHLNLFATMVLGGLWHGANWTFVAWGALHGAFLIVVHFYRASKMPKIPLWLAIVLTNLVVAFAWIFFRARTFTGASNVIASFGVPWDIDAAAKYLVDFRTHFFLQDTTPTDLLVGGFGYIVLGYVLAAAVRTQDLKSWYENAIEAGSPVRAITVVLAAWLLSYGLFIQAGAAVQFIYFDF